jgi:SPX domain protein involved in polyphosphate accumulation
MSNETLLHKIRKWFNPFHLTQYKTQHRFERKFIIPLQQIDRIETLLVANGCSPIYHQRWINNIYCDKIDMKHLSDNIEGYSERAKLRFRWYGNVFGDIQVTAEFKDKIDDVNQKASQKIGTFHWESREEIHSLYQQFQAALLDSGTANSTSDNSNSIITTLDSNAFLEVVQHQPTLINRYLRKYYMDPHESVRVTIDTDLSFYNCGTQLEHQNHEYAIVEMKSPSNSPIIDDLIPFQTSKSSKYVEGLMMTDPNFN